MVRINCSVCFSVRFNIRTASKVAVRKGNRFGGSVYYKTEANRTKPQPDPLTAVRDSKSASCININVFTNGYTSDTSYSVRAKNFYHDFRLKEADAAVGPSRFRTSVIMFAALETILRHN